MTELNSIVEITTGKLAGLHGDVLHGWAADKQKPYDKLIVEVLIDGASVAFVRADEYYASASHGDKFNGFTVQLSQEWLSNAKVIAARVANKQLWLDGTIVLPAAATNQMPSTASQVWYTGGLRIHGWAWDSTDYGRVPLITVRTDDGHLCSAKANRKHHMLTHYGVQERSFELDLPWHLADGKLHTLYVEDELGEPLTGSPIKICVWPEGVEALLRAHVAPRGPNAHLTLLTNLARQQEILAPRSAGFSSYPDWYEAFQIPGALGISNLKACGVLIISRGDSNLESLSIASVHSQRLQPLKVTVGSIKNISNALSELSAAGCESIIPVIAGDRLAPHALDHLVPLLEHGALWAYGDCDHDGPNGERTNPWLKPVWDIDLFMGADVYSAGCIIAMSALRECCNAKSPSAFKLSTNWYDTLAKLVYITHQTGNRPVHLPRVIYHRNTNCPASPEQASSLEMREESIAWLADVISPGAKVSCIKNFTGLLKIIWPLPAVLPRVSILIPTRDQFKLLQSCVEGLFNKTNYPNIEIIIIDNESTEPATLNYLKELSKRGTKVIPHPYPFNYSAVNNCAAAVASGEFICLLNNDIEIISEDWLQEMVALILRPDVGMVGAKLLWPNNMVQHGGVVIGINGLAAHTGNILERNESGYLALNLLTHEKSAVTGACMLLSKHDYDRLEGLDEALFPVAFNDIDFCLRLRESGQRILWCAQAELIHAESASRGKDIANEKRARARREQHNFLRLHSNYLMQDSHYHPGLTLDFLTGPYNGLAIPPRPSTPRA
jgi:GT2 family glycosyltransferase